MLTFLSAYGVVDKEDVVGITAALLSMAKENMRDGHYQIWRDIYKEDDKYACMIM